MQTLRQLRRTRELTFVDLALLTGIPARAIAEAEYGMRRLSHHEAEAIALVLGLPPAALFPPQPRSSPRLNGLPLALAAGLTATLAVTTLAATVAPAAQRQWQAALLHQAGVWLAATTSAPDLPVVTPASLASPSPSLRATPTPDALAPLVAPAPPRTPVPARPPQFYLDDAGPHGCPVQPATGRVVITQGYGIGTHAPAHVWGAIDLAIDSDGDGLAEPGPSWYAPIVATHDGVVKVTMHSYPAGHHVWVVAPDGLWRTGYAHLAIVTVIDGQQVRAGEVIGLMGNTGFASGPHLDYQVWRGEVNIDPTELVGCGGNS